MSDAAVHTRTSYPRPNTLDRCSALSHARMAAVFMIQNCDSCLVRTCLVCICLELGGRGEGGGEMRSGRMPWKAIRPARCCLPLLRIARVVGLLALLANFNLIYRNSRASRTNYNWHSPAAHCRKNASTSVPVTPPSRLASALSSFASKAMKNASTS